MNCHICNATINPPEPRLTATTFHFWARCCPACQQKYGERDADGKIITKLEKKEKV
ncbi:MAG: hypothetical protein AABZ15_11690 [Nitrospirota bacterium]